MKGLKTTKRLARLLYFFKKVYRKDFNPDSYLDKKNDAEYGLYPAKSRCEISVQVDMVCSYSVLEIRYDITASG